MGAPVFELYNADGTLQINLASRLTKFLGSLTINLNAAGSIVDSRLLEGTGWYACLNTDTNFRDNITPSVSFSGNTMSWSQGSYGAGYYPGTLIYGVYSNGSN